MPLNRHVSRGDNPDMTMEREKGSFDTDELSAFIYGGHEALRRKREISRKVNADPALANNIPAEFLTRERKIEETARKTKVLLQRMSDFIDTNSREERVFLFNEVIGNDGYPVALHLGMFLPALEGQADEDLAAEILPKAQRFEIIGTYAQTEMGHGTNLRELETTATYDKSTQEFVLHTPTRSAMKWWPGNLGKMSNYAVVCATLYIDSKKCGPHNFLVQLRDEKTHEPLKGITIGDIGPKLGINTTDNGFLAFDHYRIPRRNMLMKHSKVSPDGKYTAPKHAKINYGAMVHVRSHMIHANALLLAQAVTIAIRYSAIRRQGRIEPDQPEVQILDYQTQQYRLFPQLALAYATLFTGVEVRDLYNKMTEDISKGKMDLLPDLHALTSGLKSVVTFSVGLGIEQCRMSCGGHGYSLASGIPQLYGMQTGGSTYEGENMVMLQQTARYLVKAVASVAQGKPLSFLAAYLGNKDDDKSKFGSGKEDIEELLRAMEHAARRQTVDAATMLEKKTKEIGRERAWTACSVELNRASRLHTRLCIARSFHRRLLASPPSIRSVLHDLLSLHLHYECIDMAHHLLEDGFCCGWQMNLMKERLYDCLQKIRPNAVSLVDSFELSDRDLNSVLGRRDGNVYESLYEWAKKSQLNYTHVLPAVTKYMKPMMEESRASSKL